MLPRLQILRAIAALMVLALHSAYLLGDTPLRPVSETLWTFGFAGVDVFFVLSGFILAYSFYRKPGQSRGWFMTRRFLRVYSGYLPAFALCVGLFALQGRSLGEYDLLPATFLIPQDIARTPLPVVWTLYHELYYYLVFGTLCLLPRRGMMACLIGYAAMVIWVQAAFWWHGYYGTYQQWTYLPTNHRPVMFFVVSPYVLEFIAGSLLCLAMQGGWRPFTARQAICMGIGCLALGAALNAFAYHGHLIGGPRNLQRVLCFLPMAASFIYAAVVADEAGEPVRWGAELVPLGDASFSLFLIHLPLLKTLDTLIVPWRGNAGAMIWITVAAWVAILRLALWWQRRVEVPMYAASVAWAEGVAKTVRAMD